MRGHFDYSRGRKAYKQYVLLNRREGQKWGIGHSGGSTHFEILYVESKKMHLWCTHGSWGGDLHFDDAGNPTHLRVLVTRDKFDIHPSCVHMSRLDVNWWRGKALDVPPTLEEETAIAQAIDDEIAAKLAAYEKENEIPFG